GTSNLLYCRAAQRDQLVEELLHDREQQQVAIGELEIDRGGSDAGFLGDRPQRKGIFRTQPFQQPDGSVDDFPPEVIAGTACIATPRLVRPVRRFRTGAHHATPPQSTSSRDSWRVYA